MAIAAKVAKSDPESGVDEPKPELPADKKSSSDDRGAGAGVRHWFRTHRTLGIGLIVVVLAVLVVGTILLLNGGGNDKAKVAVPADSIPISQNPIVASYQTQLPALAEAAKSSPQDAAALRAYGVALYATGDVGKAQEQYEAELKVNQADPVLYNALGNVYRDLGSYDKALADYQKSISLDPATVTPYINLANLYQYTLKQPDLGITTLQAAQVSLPDNQDVGVLLGIAYEQTNDKANAQAAFEAVLKQNPDNPAAKAGLARVTA